MEQNTELIESIKVLYILNQQNIFDCEILKNFQTKIIIHGSIQSSIQNWLV